MRKILPLLAAWMFASGVLWADPAPAPSSATPARDSNVVLYPKGADTSAAPLHPEAGLAGSTMTIFVLLAGAAGGWLLWRKLRFARDLGRGSLLSISESKSLGNRQFLVVAAYGDRKFLLGVCPGRIDLLSNLEGSSNPPQR